MSLEQESFFVQEARPTILVVDDTPDNLVLMTGLLKEKYSVKVANNGERGLWLAQTVDPALILLDIMMPGMDGFEVFRRLKADERTENIPVIFVTAKSEITDETRGLELGAADYITKPISPPVVLARVRTQLMLKSATDFLRGKSDVLEREVARRTAEIQELQDAVVLAMASLAETRDNETGNHLRRTQHYVRTLAEELARRPGYNGQLTPDVIALLFKSAPLHDIGKVGIPDKILLKPGPLDREEFELMKTHTTLGREAIEHAEDSLGHEVPFLKYAKEIAQSHQEKWDGSGYPEGLKGKAIPLSARLMAVADVYDALISRRVYKPPFSHEKAVSIILEGSGKHFDPELVEAFVQVSGAFADIALRYRDEEPEDADAVKAHEAQRNQSR